LIHSIFFGWASRSIRYPANFLDQDREVQRVLRRHVEIEMLVEAPRARRCPTATTGNGPGAAAARVTVSLASRCTAPLSSTQERALKPKDSFKECDNCPEMVVVPSGSFTMGSPDSEVGRYAWEGPQRTITPRPVVRRIGIDEGACGWQVYPQ
jgi:formylglycine-generating enzyme required for sulfatase activity